MSDPTTLSSGKNRLPGLDAEATPLIGLGLGAIGLVLGWRPRLAAVPLLMTACAAWLYRDPKRVTPDDANALFSPADGTVIGMDEFYEHRFLHTDAVRLAIAISPFDVLIQRAPAAGEIAYCEHVAGGHGSIRELKAGDENERLLIGIMTEWGPIMLALVAGPMSYRVQSEVALGERVEAGSRLGSVRFGGRVDLMLAADLVDTLPEVHTHLQAGVSSLGHLVF